MLNNLLAVEYLHLPYPSIPLYTEDSPDWKCPSFIQSSKWDMWIRNRIWFDSLDS